MKSIKYYAFSILLSLLSTSISASNERTCYGKVLAPSIDGFYKDNFNGFQLVGKKIWISGGNFGELLFHYCKTINTQNYLVAQNDASNNYNPNKYSRFEWIVLGDDAWYCQQVFSADTEVGAEDFNKYPKADSSDPEKIGCGKDGQFPWTKMEIE